MLTTLVDGAEGKQGDVTAELDFTDKDDAVWRIRAPGRTIIASLKRVEDVAAGTVGLRLDYTRAATHERGSAVLGRLSKDASGKVVLTILPAAREVEANYPLAEGISIKQVSTEPRFK